MPCNRDHFDEYLSEFDAYINSEGRVLYPPGCGKESNAYYDRDCDIINALYKTQLEFGLRGLDEWYEAYEVRFTRSGLWDKGFREAFIRNTGKRPLKINGVEI